jgi:ubiquinone/menaquinone biosynthesis C-methylase UbiE
MMNYADGSFDRLFMVTVLAEFPDKVSALREFARVLKNDGVLAIGEIVLDPDYPRRKTATRWCRDAGFETVDERSSMLHYLLTFRPTTESIRTTLPC